MQASEARAEEMEAQARLLMQLATEELERRRVRIEMLEARLRAAEAKAAEAEARADAARARLQQVRDELAQRLPASMGRGHGLDAGGLGEPGGDAAAAQA